MSQINCHMSNHCFAIFLLYLVNNWMKEANKASQNAIKLSVRITHPQCAEYWLIAKSPGFTWVNGA